MGGYALGIDLGTTYSAAAVHTGSGVTEIVSLGHRSTIVPSTVFVTETGEVLVGDAAVRRGATQPERLCREFKRRIGDSVPIIVGGSPFSAEALSARLLRWIAATVAEQRGGPPDRVALTYPANWGAFKQERLAQAIRIAELTDVVDRAAGASDPILTLTEPEAAAISYASTERVPVGEVIAVYDLGGGTFDAAVLRKTEAGFEMLGPPEGIERLGGVDVDEAVYRHVRSLLGPSLDALDGDDPAVARAVARLRDDCVEAKEALSSDTQVSVPVLLPNLNTEVRLTRSELEGMVRPVLEDSVAALRRAIVGAELTPDAVDRVLLVGGSSRMPLVGQMVTEALGRPFFVDAHPKHAVALGAALTAAGVTTTTTASVPVVAADFPTPSAPLPPPPAPVPVAPVPVLPPPAPTPVPVPPAPVPPAPAPVPPPVPPPPVPTPPVTEPSPVAVSTEPVPATNVPPRPPKGSESRKGQLRIAAIAAAVLVVAVVGFLATRGGDDDGGDDGDDDIAGVTTTTTSTTAPEVTPELAIAGTTTVADEPDGIVPVDDVLWVASTNGNTVQTLDIATGEVVDSFPLEADPLAVVAADGSVFVTQRNAGLVARFDPATGSVIQSIEVPEQPAVMAFGAGAVWLGGGGGTLSKIDPATNTATTVLSDQGNVAGVAVDEDRGVVYATVHATNELLALDAESGEEIGRVAVGEAPDAVAVAPSGVWVANRGGDTLSRIDPDTLGVTAEVTVGEAPAGLAVDGDRVWAIANATGDLVLVDGSDAVELARINVGTSPLGVTTTPDTVWVTLFGGDSVVRVSATAP